MTHGAGAAGFPTRNRAALALVFFMHMLALSVWMRQRPERLPEMPEMVSVLLHVEPPRPAVRAPHLEPARPPGLNPRRLPPPVPVPLPLPAIATPVDAPASPAPIPPAAVPSLDDAHAPITVQDAIREQQEADGGFAVGLAKRQAGRIDRTLRKGKSGVPDEADTPMGRFRRGLEAAHIDRSTSVRIDSYTSPDGIVVYRTRVGKDTYCRRSGSVSPLGMRGMVMGNEAGDVPCPKGVQWKAD